MTRKGGTQKYMARPKKIKEAIQQEPIQKMSEEKSIKKGSTVKNKISTPDLNEKIKQDKIDPENKNQEIDISDQPKSNIELYVESVIKEMKENELAEKFKKAVELHGTQQVSIRLEREVLDFYKNLPLDCTTAMKKALRIVKEVMETQNFKL